MPVTQQSITKDASTALDLLFVSTVGLSLRRFAKLLPPPLSTLAGSDLDSRECQRQLAAFDVRLAAAEIAAASSTQHLQPNDTAAASVPVTATPLPAVASTASLASSASKASVGGSNNNNNADGKQQLGGAASSKGSLLSHSKSDASVADSSKGSSSSPSDADDNDSPHVYLRCTLPDRHSDIDACSLDWCAELHDIVVATESTTTPSIDRAFVCKMVHNLRLTKLAINHIDAAFARDCMHLERLDICDNVLRSLDHLPPSLLEVDAYRNQLQTVHLSSSSPTPHLVHVGLGLNMLTSLPTLSHPHTLLSLDLSYNHVTDFAHVLSGLNVFSGLRHVFFTGNPVVLCRGYRHALLASHPNLYVLDDITVSDKEKDVLLQSPAILADNGADLTVYVTAVGFPLRKPQADATAPSITYEATVDVLPGQWSVTMKEDGSMKQPDQPSAAAMPAPGGALNFEATRVPLPVSLALRDIVKFHPASVRIYEVLQPPPSAPPPAGAATTTDAEPRPPLQELRVSVNVDLGGFLKPCSLEHRLGELTVVKSFQCIALKNQTIPVVPDVMPPPSTKGGSDKGGPTPEPPVTQDVEITVTVKFVLNESERVRPSPSREQVGSKSKGRH